MFQWKIFRAWIPMRLSDGKWTWLRRVVQYAVLKEEDESCLYPVVGWKYYLEQKFYCRRHDQWWPQGTMCNSLKEESTCSECEQWGMYPWEYQDKLKRRAIR